MQRIAYRVVGNSGFPCDGFWMNWRGRKDWCQPREFSNWKELMGAAERRLHLAGLRLWDAVVDWQGEVKTLRVLVSRGAKLKGTSC
jgi:hypothetical protein